MYLKILTVAMFTLLATAPFLTSTAHASSGELKDQTSCQSISGIWNSASETCTVSSLGIGYSDTFTINNSVYPNITLVVNGPISISDSCSRVGCHAGTLSNNGHLVIASSGSITSNAILDNQGTLDNFGTINSNARSAVGNSGTINNEAGAVFYCAYCVGLSNSGVFNNLQGSLLDGTGTISNAGTIINNGTFYGYGDYYNYVPGTIINSAIMDSGYFYNYNIVNNTATGIVTNTGTYYNSGGNVFNSGTLVNNSTGTLTNNGVINNLCMGTIDNFGTLAGNAPINPCTVDTTQLTSSPNPSVFGQPVNFTATVSSSAASGTVTFLNGTSVLGTASLSGGVASIATSAFNTGSYSVTAKYSGDSTFLPSKSGAVVQNINKASTTVSLVSSAPNSVFNQTISFTFVVSPVSPASGTPTGNVTLTIDGMALPPISIPFGENAYYTSALPLGTHKIMAQYLGSGNFLASTSPTISQVITKASTATSLTSSIAKPVFGQKITYTARVSALSPSSGTPTGNVTFFIDGTPRTPVALSAGKATLLLNTLTVGNHTISAQYSGSTNYTASTSHTLSQTIIKASTKTVLTSSINPSVSGQKVTFSANVLAVSPSSGMPTGTVTFTIDGVVQPPVAISHGRAALSITTLSSGSHAITAQYSGSSSYNTSTSATLTQKVN